MKIKTVSVYPDDRLAFHATITWVRDDGTLLLDDMETSICLPISANWADDEALQIVLHTGLAKAILRQSPKKAMALGMQQEDYFSAIHDWNGTFVLNGGTALLIRPRSD